MRRPRNTLIFLHMLCAATLLAMPIAMAQTPEGTGLTSPEGMRVQLIPSADGLIITLLDVPETVMGAETETSCTYWFTHRGTMYENTTIYEHGWHPYDRGSYCLVDLATAAPAIGWPTSDVLFVEASVGFEGVEHPATGTSIDRRAEQMSSRSALLTALVQAGYEITSLPTADQFTSTYFFIWEATGPLGTIRLSINEGWVAEPLAEQCECDERSLATERACVICGRSHIVLIETESMDVANELGAIIRPVVE